MHQQQEAQIIDFAEQSENQGDQFIAQTTSLCQKFTNFLMRVFRLEKKQQNYNNNGIYKDEIQNLIEKDEGNLNPIIQITQSQIRETQTFVYNLYDKTTKSRIVDYQFRSFVRDQLDFNELKKNYNLSLQSGKELRAKFCDSFRIVRGDGNCFYTAFGFQFFQHLLFNYRLEDFNEFINQCLAIQLPMKLYLDEQEEITNQNLEKVLLNNFLNRLQKLRLIQDENERFKRFLQQVAADEKQNDDIDGCFYALQTIFLRNYCNHVVETHEMKDALFDRKNLLIWEKECNSNEIIIQALSISLKLHIILIFFENKGFIANEYGGKNNQKVILLIKPGHYNIGINSGKQSVNEFTQQIQ